MILLFSPIRKIKDKLSVTVNGEEISNDLLVMKPSESFNEVFDGIMENDKITVMLGTEKLFSSEDNFVTSVTDTVFRHQGINPIMNYNFDDFF